MTRHPGTREGRKKFSLGGKRQWEGAPPVSRSMRCYLQASVMIKFPIAATKSRQSQSESQDFSDLMEGDEGARTTREKRRRSSSSASTSSHSTPVRRRVCKFNEERYEELKRFVKNERARHVDRGEKLDILAVQGRLRYEHWVRGSSPGRPKKIKFAHRTAELLNRSNQTCTDVSLN